tara:strand:+ start:97 stop:246 length:150 start_codon:yes stop_codon:yes gene_type:complete
MRNKSHKLKPSEFHVKCETDKCPNYYNAQYSNANGYCKPCNVGKKNGKL